MIIFLFYCDNSHKFSDSFFYAPGDVADYLGLPDEIISDPKIQELAESASANKILGDVFGISGNSSKEITSIAEACEILCRAFPHLPQSFICLLFFFLKIEKLPFDDFVLIGRMLNYYQAYGASPYNKFVYSMLSSYIFYTFKYFSNIENFDYIDLCERVLKELDVIESYESETFGDPLTTGVVLTDSQLAEWWDFRNKRDAVEMVFISTVIRKINRFGNNDQFVGAKRICESAFFKALSDGYIEHALVFLLKKIDLFMKHRVLFRIVEKYFSDFDRVVAMGLFSDFVIETESIDIHSFLIDFDHNEIEDLILKRANPNTFCLQKNYKLGEYIGKALDKFRDLTGYESIEIVENEIVKRLCVIKFCDSVIKYLDEQKSVHSEALINALKKVQIVYVRDLRIFAICFLISKYDCTQIISDENIMKMLNSGLI